MDPVTLVAFLVGAAAATFGVTAASSYLWGLGPVAKEIARLPLVKIDDAPANEEVRIVGTLRATREGLTRSPLTGKECLAWTVRVVSRQDRRHLLIMESGSGSSGFLLEDGSSHQACVIAVGLNVEMKRSQVSVSERRQAELLERHKLTTSRWLVFEEGLLQPGDKVVVGALSVGVVKGQLQLLAKRDRDVLVTTDLRAGDQAKTREPRPWKD